MGLMQGSGVSMGGFLPVSWVYGVWCMVSEIADWTTRADTDASSSINDLVKKLRSQGMSMKKGNKTDITNGIRKHSPQLQIQYFVNRPANPQRRQENLPSAS